MLSPLKQIHSACFKTNGIYWDCYSDCYSVCFKQTEFRLYPIDPCLSSPLFLSPTTPFLSYYLLSGEHKSKQERSRVGGRKNFALLHHPRLASPVLSSLLLSHTISLTYYLLLGEDKSKQERSCVGGRKIIR
jgi:hypothetical protein